MDIFFKKAEEYFEKEQFQTALKYYKKYCICLKCRDNNYELSLCFFKIGSCYFELDKFNEAINELNNALNNIQSVGDQRFRKLKFDILSLLSTVFYTSGQYQKSVSSILSAKEVLFVAKDSFPVELSKVYNSLANLYSLNQEFDKSIDYRFRAINLIKGKCKEAYNLLGLYYNNLAVSFSKINKYKIKLEKYGGRSYLLYFIKALYYLEKYPPYASEVHVANVYNNISFYYQKTSHFKKELYFLKKSLKAFGKINGDNDYHLSFLYVNFGYFYYNQLNYKKAINYYNKSLNIRIKKLGRKNSLLVRNYFYIGNCYLRQEKLILSLRYYQKALNILTQGPFVKSYFNNPNVENVTFLPDLVDVLFSKAKVLFTYWLIKKNSKYLHSAFDTHNLLEKLIDKIRKNLSSEESKAVLSSKVQLLSEHSIEVSLALFSLTNESYQIEKAFNFLEKCKASILLESINDSKAKTLGGIPKKILEKEKNLKNNITAYEKLIFDEKSKRGKIDKLKIANVESELFNLKQSLDELIKYFEKNYKDYYDLKYNYTAAKISDIQSNLSKGEVLIEYFLGEQFIFIFKITKDNYSVKKITKNKSFDAKLKRFRKCLILENQGLKNEFKEFVSLSYYFYKLLLKDLISEESISKLIIIPDSMLNYIPFETLIIKKPAPNDTFKNIFYLLEKYDVRYSYSSTLFLRNIKKRKSKNSKEDLKVLGFAPSFKKSESVLEKEDTLRSGLSNLKWNVKEIRNSRKYFGGLLFTNNRAAKKVFLKEAGSYPILHLATHGIVEDQNPMFSKIAFTQMKNSANDGYLHTYELYNMNINSDLTILSACDTGYGKFVKGEGVMSIARGFIYAGSRSIMMSLWQVSDFATCKIVDYFYKGLSEGMNKDEALRKAKLKYLRSSDSIKSNPAYWAPFVLIGNNSPLT